MTRAAACSVHGPARQRCGSTHQASLALCKQLAGEQAVHQRHACSRGSGAGQVPNPQAWLGSSTAPPPAPASTHRWPPRRTCAQHGGGGLMRRSPRSPERSLQAIHAAGRRRELQAPLFGPRHRAAVCKGAGTFGAGAIGPGAGARGRRRRHPGLRVVGRAMLAWHAEAGSRGVRVRVGRAVAAAAAGGL